MRFADPQWRGRHRQLQGRRRAPDQQTLIVENPCCQARCGLQKARVGQGLCRQDDLARRADVGGTEQAVDQALHAFLLGEEGAFAVRLDQGGAGHGHEHRQDQRGCREQARPQRAHASSRASVKPSGSSLVRRRRMKTSITLLSRSPSSS